MSRSGFPFAVTSSTVAGVAATASAPVGCGPGPLPLPPGPDLDALAPEYRAPTGTVSPRQIDGVIAAAQQRLAELPLDWLPDLLAQSMTRLRERLDDNRVLNDPSTAANLNHPRIDAAIRLTRTCRDWGNPPGPANAPANGTIALTAVDENSVLPRTLVASASNGRNRLQPINPIVVDDALDLEVLVDGGLGLILRRAGADHRRGDARAVQRSGQVGTSTATYRCDAALQICGPM